MSIVDDFQGAVSKFFVDGVECTMEISDPYEYKVGDREIFVDSGGGYWTRCDGYWCMFDPGTAKVSSSGVEWNEIVVQYGPVFYVGDF